MLCNHRRGKSGRVAMCTSAPSNDFRYDQSFFCFLYRHKHTFTSQLHNGFSKLSDS